MSSQDLKETLKPCGAISEASAGRASDEILGQAISAPAKPNSGQGDPNQLRMKERGNEGSRTDRSEGRERRDFRRRLSEEGRA